jgi:hypothetical protein
MAPSTTAAAAAAAADAPARTVRLLVDGPGRRVVLAEAGESAAAFLSSLLDDPVHAALDALLREDPASAAAGCFRNLAAAEALLQRGAASSSSTTTSTSFRALHPRAPAGLRIMARRLFRCAHIGCPCSDVASREAGSACPCDSPSCAAADARRHAELHFLEACFYRRPDGSAATGGRRGGGRSGDTFYRCRARDERRAGAARDIFPCRFRVTDERGVECPLCGGRTTVEVKCAGKAGEGEGSSARKPDAATSYAVMDDLAVRPVPAGLSGAALLSALGVAVDADDVREETVPFGYKEVGAVSPSIAFSSSLLVSCLLRC